MRLGPVLCAGSRTTCATAPSQRRPRAIFGAVIGLLGLVTKLRVSSSLPLALYLSSSISDGAILCLWVAECFVWRCCLHATAVQQQ